MNKEELKQEAEKHADGIYHYKINVSDYGEDGIINYRYSDVKEAYLAGAEPREKQIAKFEEQIEKMKCCGNCRFSESDKLNGTFCHREGCFVVASAKCKLWDR